LPIADASAAEVFTKNKGLNGSVVGVTAEGVEFETIYGKGTILIQWSDVESILSDKSPPKVSSLKRFTAKGLS
jgi:hypothetical protein